MWIFFSSAAALVAAFTTKGVTHHPKRHPRRVKSKTERVTADASLLFKFGIIADVQFADVNDGPNFARTRTRRYRQSLETLRGASLTWAAERVDFCVGLGDLVDTKVVSEGKTAAAKERAVNDVKAAMQLANAPWHVAFGNHDFAVLSRPDLATAFFRFGGGGGHRVAENTCDTSAEEADDECPKLWYDFSPAPGFRCCVVDAYEISVVGAAGGTMGRQKAAQLLASRNHNIDAENPARPSSELRAGWLDGMSGLDVRWVPYNGAFGDAQLDWLDATVRRAAENNETLFVFSHVPVYHRASKPNNCAWNADAVLRILDAHRPLRLAWWAGHDHDGGYTRRTTKCGTTSEHHLTPAAPLECEPGEVSFGTVAVYADRRCVVDWRGKRPPDPADPWPDVLHF